MWNGHAAGMISRRTARSEENTRGAAGLEAAPTGGTVPQVVAAVVGAEVLKHGAAAGGTRSQARIVWPILATTTAAIAAPAFDALCTTLVLRQRHLHGP
jgi:hypothetical protein